MTSRVAGLRFTETMRGYFAQGGEDDFREAYRRGRREKTTLKFTLTVYAADLAATLADERHEADITGTVTAPVLQDSPLRVDRGRFHLFVRDEQDERTRRMIYHLPMEGNDGKRYFLDGYKLIRDDRGFDLWYDTTALFITVHEGDSSAGPVVGRGLLRIYMRDFIPQLLSMRITGGVGLLRGCSAMIAFLSFFGGVLAKIYVLGKFCGRRRGSAADRDVCSD